MLQSLHEHIKGWIAGIIIGAVSLSFVLWGVQYYLQRGEAGGGAVAKVGGKKITENELNITYQRAQRQFAEQHGVPPTPVQNAQLKQAALQNLILNNVLLSSAEDAGFRISRNQVNQFIMSIPSFQENRRFSPQRYRQLLYANGVTPKQFAAQTSNLLVVNQVQSGIQSSAFVLPSEAKSGYDLLYQKRAFGYFVVPSANYLKTVKVTPEIIANYYQDHKRMFEIPEQVSIAYIVISPKQIAKTIKITDAEIKQYYQNNLDNYRTAQRWKIQRIFMSIPNAATPQQVVIARQKAQQLTARMKNGANFQVVFKEQEGITQTVTSSEISPQMSQVLSLLKPGQVSQPFKTSKGMNIVRLVSTVPAKTKPFDKVKDQIKKVVIQQKANAILTKQSDQLSDISYTNPTTLAPAAEDLNAKIETSPLFTQKGTKNGIASHPNIVAAAFSDEVLQDGNNSNAIELKDGSIVVLRVKRHLPSRIQRLKEVSTHIKQQVTQQLAEAKAALVASNVETALNQGKSVSSIVNQYHLVWHAKPAITRDNKNIPHSILSAAFRLPLKQGYSAGIAVLKNGDSAVIKVISVANANYDKASQEKQQQAVTDMTKYLGTLDYKVYVNSARKKAKVKIIK